LTNFEIIKNDPRNFLKNYGIENISISFLHFRLSKTRFIVTNIELFLKKIINFSNKENVVKYLKIFNEKGIYTKSKVFLKNNEELIPIKNYKNRIKNLKGSIHKKINENFFSEIEIFIKNEIENTNDEEKNIILDFFYLLKQYTTKWINYFQILIKPVKFEDLVKIIEDLDMLYIDEIVFTTLSKSLPDYNILGSLLFFFLLKYEKLLDNEVQEKINDKIKTNLFTHTTKNSILGKIDETFKIYESDKKRKLISKDENCLFQSLYSIIGNTNIQNFCNLPKIEIVDTNKEDNGDIKISNFFYNFEKSNITYDNNYFIKNFTPNIFLNLKKKYENSINIKEKIEKLIYLKKKQPKIYNNFLFEIKEKKIFFDEILHNYLKEYQKICLYKIEINFIEKEKNFLLMWKPGSGKTIISICLIFMIIKFQKISNSILLICPPSLLKFWSENLKIFCLKFNFKNIKVYVCDGVCIFFFFSLIFFKF
jgi:hypothetical protein